MAVRNHFIKSRSGGALSRLALIVADWFRCQMTKPGADENNAINSAAPKERRQLYYHTHSLSARMQKSASSSPAYGLPGFLFDVWDGYDS